MIESASNFGQALTLVLEEMRPKMSVCCRHQSQAYLSRLVDLQVIDRDTLVKQFFIHL
jgi:hypothetical protein